MSEPGCPSHQFFRIAKRRARRVGLALLGMLLGLGCGALHAQEADAKSGEKEDVTLSGHLARGEIRTHDSVRFWLTIRNRTSGALKDIRIVHQDTPGFGALQPCWGKSVDANCGLPEDTEKLCRDPARPQGPGSGGNLLCAYLAAGGAFTVWGDLPATRGEARHRNFLAVSWQDAADKGTLSSIDLGESRTVNRWLSPLVWLRGKPEVTIPGVLTLLGLLAAWLSSRRDARQQMTVTMLAETHQASMQFYMPTCSMIGAALASLERCFAAMASTDPDDAELRVRTAFYYVTMFHWWHLQTFREVGAYHFRDRVAEVILRSLYGRHKELCALLADQQRRKLDRLLVLVSKQTSLNDFLSLLEYPRTDVQDVWQIFRGWVFSNACRADFEVLSAYRLVMVYEVNRPYLTWHGMLYPIELTADAAAEVKRCQVGKDEKLSLARVEEYLERTRQVRKESLRERVWYWTSKTGRNLKRGKWV